MGTGFLGELGMAVSGNRLRGAVEEYLAELGRVRATGGGTAETSYYIPLGNLLNAVGATLRPRVYCVSQMADQGAGHPDFGIYAAQPDAARREAEAGAVAGGRGGGGEGGWG